MSGLGKLTKRLGQLGRFGLHFVQHWRSLTLIHQCRERGIATWDRRLPFKYLGDYISQIMSLSERRAALIGHYQRLLSLTTGSSLFADSQQSVLLWSLNDDHGGNSLRLLLEPARLAPMEGELQLRFVAGTRDLCTLTFLLVPGQLFDLSAETAVFVGGVQGGVRCRNEIRQAAKLNGEIAPIAMLLITIQAVSKVLRIDDIICVTNENQISTGYAADKIKLNYEALWREEGGFLHGEYYRLPFKSFPKPLAEIAISHRSRTRRKRERKLLIQTQIEAQLKPLFQAEYIMPLISP